MLHTTDAYQAAVLELFTAEAGFAARQLNLPPVPASADRWLDAGVAPVPHGVSGHVSTGDYDFSFLGGRLRSIRKRDWLGKVTPPVRDLLELAERGSLLDAQSACDLARQWLTALSVDIVGLERRCSPTVFQVPARRTDAVGRPLRGIENNVAVPLFMIGWGDSPAGARLRALAGRIPPGRMSAVSVEILGTNKELISLEIQEPDVLQRPLLQVTNAEELFGSSPPPRHFVEELVGGTDAYETVAAPDRVEAWLLTSSRASESETYRKKKERAGPVRLNRELTQKLSSALLDFNTYVWSLGRKACIINYGARLRFTRGSDTVEFLLCCECDVLSVSHAGRSQSADFDRGRDALVKALQAAFPRDKIVNQLNAKIGGS